MDSDESCGLRSLVDARQPTDAEVRQFLEDAVAHCSRLKDLLRLRGVEIAALYARVERVMALCDLSEWADEELGHGRPSVLIDDLRRAIGSDERAISSDQH
jgi:hypothetical protein